MNKPLISVIIPVYNQEKWIIRCIRSLLNQKNITRQQFELIIINDGSTDRTNFALDGFKDEITIIKNKQKTNLPSALNQGIKKSNSKYIVRVDGDDYVNENYLYLLMEFLEQNKYMDAIACDYFIVNDNEEILSRENCFNSPIGCGIMFKTSDLLDIGLYDENFNLCEEEELKMRFEKKYKIHRLELPLYRYRKHEKNITNNKKDVHKFKRKLKKNNN